MLDMFALDIQKAYDPSKKVKEENYLMNERKPKLWRQNENGGRKTSKKHIKEI